MDTRTLITGGFTFRSTFDLRQQVFIDGDERMRATINGIMFSDGSYECRCAYILNGVPQAPWIEHWRLTLAS